MESPELVALEAQLHELVVLVNSLSEQDFDRPTRCPGWSVAELVAHCEGMLHRLVGANAEPVEAEPEIDRVGYYRYDPDGPREGEDPDKTFSEVIRDRVIDEVGGRDAGELRASLEAAVSNALDGIRELPASRVIKRSGHPPMRFREFVASRNLEFGVHVMDIAHAVGRPERTAPEATTAITDILDGLLGSPVPASLQWDATTYILSGTGRRPIDPSERVALGELAERFPLLQ